jgi:hypothetical protein
MIIGLLLSSTRRQEKEDRRQETGDRRQEVEGKKLVS